MQLHQLRYFVSIVETGSVTKAALQCHISQPSISQQINKLEDSIGNQLFDRSGGKFELTDTGSILYTQAIKILNTVQDTKRQIEEHSKMTDLVVRIGVIPTISPFILPQILVSLHARYPSVNIHIREEVSEEICAACSRGELDVVLTADPISQTELQSSHLFGDRLYLAVKKDHRLAKHGTVSLSEVENEPFILMEDIHCLSKQIEHLCFSNNFVPRVMFQASQIATVKQLIELGYGVSILPEISKPMTVDSHITYLSLSELDAKRDLVVATRDYSSLNEASREFIQLVKQCVSSMDC